MKIADRKIGFNVPPLVIADIGINHEGSLKTAKHMVQLAAKAGCECIKHQTHIVDDEMTEEAKSIFPPNSDESIWHIMERCSLSLEQEEELKIFSEKLGLIWISTPFSRAAVDFLDEIGVPAFKIGSGEADNIPLIRHIAAKGKPVIMSTGMQTIKSLAKSVEILEEAKIEYALLECTNLYPSPPDIVSLSGVTELIKAFPKFKIGNIQTPRRSNEIFKAKNNPKIRSDPEEAVYKFARASLVADSNLQRGHIISSKDIWARRPGTGEIPGFEFDKVIGKKINRDVKRNEQLKWSYFK